MHKTNIFITIHFSHYCEKARWALDRAGVAYREDSYLPLQHFLGTRLQRRGSSTPVLVTQDHILTDSSEILPWCDQFVAADQKLYPKDIQEEVVTWEQRLDGRLGIWGRLWFYDSFFRHPDFAVNFLAPYTAPLGKRGLKVLFPAFKATMRRALKMYPTVVRKALPRVNKDFDAVEDVLSDGRLYLCGDRFTAADLTFSALAAPLIVPAQYGIPLPPINTFPSDVRETVLLYRNRPAGQHALRMYQEHRR